MLFPTVRFTLFFLVVLPTSWLLAHKRTRWRVFMLAASYVFYGNWDARFVFLLAGSTLANQAIAIAIHRSRHNRVRDAWLALGVIANLGLLAWFKYYDFFVNSAMNIMAPLGVNWQLPLRQLVLPIGISFITFQALSYVIDTYRRQVEPSSMLDFAVYLSFFPHLVAGPIVRASEFLPQLKQRLDPRNVDIGLGFWLIGIGLFKKVVISSYLASTIVDPVFAFPRQHLAFDTLLGIYGYAIQIYADFSGYTDMAIGLALLIGFRFPQNFDSPYTAVSLQDFWRRWHMTLSRWLRDYLYIPLGGSRGSKRRGYINLGLTMILGGLWHGAAWTFVAWGTLHGVGLGVERWKADRDKTRARDLAAIAPPPEGLTALTPHGMTPGEPSPPVPTYGANKTPRPGVDSSAGAKLATAPTTPSLATLTLSERVGALTGTSINWGTLGRRFLTFNFVCLAWVFFRASSFTGAFEVLARLFHWGSAMPFNLVLVLVIVGSIASQYVPQHATSKAQAWFSRCPWWIQSTTLAGWITMCTVLGPIGIAPFIYFQF